MALTDINFQEGESQTFLVELPVGTLNSPKDILIENSHMYPVLEIPSKEGSGGGNIFIMSE